MLLRTYKERAQLIREILTATDLGQLEEINFQDQDNFFYCLSILISSLLKPRLEAPARLNKLTIEKLKALSEDLATLSWAYSPFYGREVEFEDLAADAENPLVSESELQARVEQLFGCTLEEMGGLVSLTFLFNKDLTEKEWNDERKSHLISVAHQAILHYLALFK